MKGSENVYAFPILGADVSPARVESAQPVSLRVARYPDGSRRIQGAYPWSQGIAGGVAWRDLPMVDVDPQGNEIVE